MGGKRWQTPEQLNFIRRHIPAYNEASKGSRKQLIRFWPILEAAWWGEFPLKDELVKRDMLPASVLEIGFEFVEGSPEEVLYKKELTKRKEQIKTLIRYEHRQASLKSGISDPSRVAISTAAKNFVKPTRRCFQPQEMYYHLYKGEVDALFEAEKAGLEGVQGGEVAAEDEDEDTEDIEGDGDDGKEDKKGKKGRGWNLRLRRQIFTREWEQASPERRAAVFEEIEKQKGQISMESSLEETGRGLVRDADSRLGWALTVLNSPVTLLTESSSSLQRVNAFWAANARLCWDNAAMMSVQIGIAPDPSKGDKLVSMSISYGLDSNGKVFQDAFPNFHEVIVKPIITWAKANVFTQRNWEKAKAKRVASRQAGENDRTQGDEGKAGLGRQGQGVEKRGGTPVRGAVSKEDLSAKGYDGERGNQDDEDGGEVGDHNDGLSLSDSFDAMHQLEPVSQTEASSLASPSPTTIIPAPDPAQAARDGRLLPTNPVQPLPTNPAQPLSTNPARPPASCEAPTSSPLQPGLLPPGSSSGHPPVTQVSPQFADSPQSHALNGMFGAMPSLFAKIVDSVPLQQGQGANSPVASVPGQNQPFLLPETRSPQCLLTPGAINQHPSSLMEPMSNASIDERGFLGNNGQDSFGPGTGTFPFGQVGLDGPGLGGDGVFPFENSTISMPQMSLSAYLLDDNMIDPPDFDTYHSYSNNTATLPPFHPDPDFTQPPSYNASTFPFNPQYSNQLFGAVPSQAPNPGDFGHSALGTSSAFGGQPTDGLVGSQVATLTPSGNSQPHPVLDPLVAASNGLSHTVGTPPAQAATTPLVQAPPPSTHGPARTGMPQTPSTPTAHAAPPPPDVSEQPIPLPGGILAITTNAPAKPSAAQGSTKTSKKATTTKSAKQVTGPATEEGSQTTGEEPSVKPKPKPKPKPTKKRKSDAVEPLASDPVDEGRGKRTKTPAKRFDGDSYVAVGPINAGSRVAKAKGDLSG